VVVVAKGEIALVPRIELDQDSFRELLPTAREPDEHGIKSRGKVGGTNATVVKEEPEFESRRVKKEEDTDNGSKGRRRNGDDDHHHSRCSQDQLQSSKRRRSPDNDDRRQRKDGTEKRSRRDKDDEDRKPSHKNYSSWLRPNIRVRVVTDKLGKRWYQQKGVVLDVTIRSKGAEATLQMADGRILDHVPERYLETALPKPGGNAVVLMGPSRFAKGKLLERDSRANQGVIQVFEDMNILTLSLDDMAEWCGPLDDDLLE
jgi:hypothetical protein